MEQVRLSLTTVDIPPSFSVMQSLTNKNNHELQTMRWFLPLNSRRLVRVAGLIVAGTAIFVITATIWTFCRRDAALQRLDGYAIVGVVAGHPELAQCERCVGKYAPSVMIEWCGPNLISRLIGNSNYLLAFGTPVAAEADILVDPRDFLRELQYFDGIKRLDLSRVDVSDKTLVQIESLTHLDEVSLGPACLSQHAVMRLQRARPRLKIDHENACLKFNEK